MAVRNEQGSLQVVLAAAGHGKTRWLELGAGPDTVVVDDLHQLDADDQLAVARRLALLPSEVSLVLASRAPVDAQVTGLVGRPVVEVGPGELRLDVDGVESVLRDALGGADPDLATTVQEVTAGWPALVALVGADAAAGLRERGALVAAFANSRGRGAAFLHGQVLPHLSASAAELLLRLGELDLVAEDLARRVGGELSDPAAALAELLRVGVVAPGPDGLRVVPVLAAVLRVDRAPDVATLLSATDWYLEQGQWGPAAAALHRAGQVERCAALVLERAPELLGAGFAHDLLRMLPDLPGSDTDPGLLLVTADATRMIGDTTQAERLYERIIGSGRPHAALAWRVAALHYSRAEYAAAIRVCEEPDSIDQVEEPRRLAVLASAHFMLGDGARASLEAAAALEAAKGLDDDRLLAAAHLASALASTGARRDNHLAAALQAARRAGDLVLATRALLNQADGLLTQADHEHAVDVAREAVAGARRASPPGALVSALNTLGEALTGLGRFEEADTQFRRSLGVSRRCGLSRTAGALHGLAELAFQAGHHDRSRAAYAEVVTLARDTGEQQVLVPALARLALLGGDGAPPEELVDEALRIAEPEFRVTPLVVRSVLSLNKGDRETAHADVLSAIGLARSEHQQASLAEALEQACAVLRALGDDAAAATALDEAWGIWERGGGVVAADRVGAARAELSAVGVRIRVLGAFEVLVDGEPVPVPAWRSRQARSLLKILVARRGRAISRGELCELLWPDDDPERTGHRLSVLISAVRAVLDPVKRWPPDHYVVADLMGLRVDLDRVGVDLERFVADAERAAVLADMGDAPAARAVLADLVTAYRGDAFEDEPYEEWARGPREELRAVWLRCLRLSATLSGRSGDIDHAVTCLVRLLNADGYDEVTHRTLVALLVRAGRHGEARRAFERWASAMRDIDAAPPPPSVLGALISC
ncbi:BTAD domain-containing putative transcriptional regulator [Nocardioides sp.]|uniref:BTAD domain-containing putative transcriptional regulator n=1 Tax=Nocardioides sp. TaxID=35761 RepID=UPI003D130974